MQPDLDKLYPISQEQHRQFQRDGFILIRQLAEPEEVAFYRKAIVDAVARLNTEKRRMEDRDTYGKAFLQTMNLWRNDEAVKKFVFARRFARAAAELLGVSAVRLYHDQALFKEGHGGHTPWHQDHYYWPLDTDNAITMWMPLVRVPVEMGALTFAASSHRNGFLVAIEISDESHDRFDRYVKEKGYPVVNYEMEIGDATFHHGWVLHSAPANAGDATREVMTIIYMADGARAVQPDNPHRANDLATWLPGVKPGEPAASKINPILYRRD